MRISDHVVLVPSAAYTATFNTQSYPLDVSMYKEACFYLDVTAASGTNPTLDIAIYQFNETGNDWHLIASFAQKTTTGTGIEYVTNCLGRKIAAVCTIGGTTPSFTFSLAVDLKD